MDTPPTETFGQKVARLRRAAGLTQEQLADKAGVLVGSLRGWEQGFRRPRADAALALARALGVTVEELLAAPPGRAAGAGKADTPGLRSLKRAWERATEAERKSFLEFVAGQERAGQAGALEGRPSGGEDAAKGRRKPKPPGGGPGGRGRKRRTNGGG